MNNHHFLNHINPLDSDLSFTTISDTLNKRLLLRHTREELCDMGVLKYVDDDDFNRRNKLKQETGETLKRKLETRPDATFLINQGILKSKITQHGELLQRQMTLDLLSKKLSERPGSIDLIRKGYLTIDQTIDNMVKSDNDQWTNSIINNYNINNEVLNGGNLLFISPTNVESSKSNSITTNSTGLSSKLSNSRRSGEIKRSNGFTFHSYSKHQMAQEHRIRQQAQLLQIKEKAELKHNVLTELKSKFSPADSQSSSSSGNDVGFNIENFSVRVLKQFCRELGIPIGRATKKGLIDLLSPHIGSVARIANSSDSCLNMPNNVTSLNSGLPVNLSANNALYSAPRDLFPIIRVTSTGQLEPLSQHAQIQTNPLQQQTAFCISSSQQNLIHYQPHIIRHSVSEPQALTLIITNNDPGLITTVSTDPAININCNSNNSSLYNQNNINSTLINGNNGELYNFVLQPTNHMSSSVESNVFPDPMESDIVQQKCKRISNLYQQYQNEVKLFGKDSLQAQKTYFDLITCLQQARYIPPDVDLDSLSINESNIGSYEEHFSKLVKFDLLPTVDEAAFLLNIDNPKKNEIQSMIMNNNSDHANNVNVDIDSFDQNCFLNSFDFSSYGSRASNKNENKHSASEIPILNSELALECEELDEFFANIKNSMSPMQMDVDDFPSVDLLDRILTPQPSATTSIF